MQEREEVFEFAEKPKVSKDGDKWTIAFASKGKCDATVAIIDQDGKIVRHLASGVLGANAPHPFQQNSLGQKIEWDGLTTDFKKADLAGCKVRVSLKLQAKYDKSIGWDPAFPPTIKPYANYEGNVYGAFVGTGPDGLVYVMDTARGDSLRCRAFDKDGKYVKTVIPTPAADVEKVAPLLSCWLSTTKWGDKVMVSDRYGPVDDNQKVRGKPLEAAKQWQLDLLAKLVPGVEFKPASPPANLQSTKACGAGGPYVSADRARDEIYVSGAYRFIGKTGERDMTWFSDPKRTLAGGYDHCPRAFGNGVDALWTGVAAHSMTGQPGSYAAPNGTILIGIHEVSAKWAGENGIIPKEEADKIIARRPKDPPEKAEIGDAYVTVRDSDGKVLSGNAVGATNCGGGMTMDRDGNIYAVFGGIAPADQAKMDASDLPAAMYRTQGGTGALVKFRGLGGKFPLNVGDNVTKMRGPNGPSKCEVRGALWAYAGVTGQTEGDCQCHRIRHDMDFFARSFIPSTQLYSVTVLDANMNRIARFGRYGNVDDTEADVKAGKGDGIRIGWMRCVAASDAALYVSDPANGRVLRAALSYAAEETVPVP